MSAVNVELVRYVYESGLFDRDPEELLTLATPDIEYILLLMRSSRVCAAGRLRRAVHAPLRRSLGRIPPRAPGVVRLWGRCCGRRQLAHTRSGSDSELVHKEAHTWTLREGRIARFEWGQDLGTALAAAGSPD